MVPTSEPSRLVVSPLHPWRGEAHLERHLLLLCQGLPWWNIPWKVHHLGRQEGEVGKARVRSLHPEQDAWSSVPHRGRIAKPHSCVALQVR